MEGAPSPKDTASQSGGNARSTLPAGCLQRHPVAFASSGGAPSPSALSVSGVGCASPHTTASQRAVRKVRNSFTSPRRIVLMAGSVLAVCAGIVDVVAWLQLGSFVTHVSGNMAHMGMRVEGNHAGRDSPGDLRESILLVVSFCVGAMLCGMLIARNEVHFGQELYGLALTGNAALIFLAVGLGHCEISEYFLAAACGLQNGMCTMHFGAICRTTHVTGIVTDLGTTIGRILAILFRRGCVVSRLDALDRAEIEVDFNKIRVYMFLGCGFLLGAGSGAWLSRWFGLYALVVPGCVTGSGGLTYMFFRKHLKEYLERLEQKRLTEDIEQVENILERARSFLDEYQQSQNVGDDNYTMKEMSSTSIVCDLDGQMSHALDVVRTMEASIVSLNHRRSTRSGHSGGQQLYRGHSHCTNSDCGSPRRWGSSSPGRLSNTRSVGPGAASPIRALRSPANRAQYPSAEKPPDAKSQIVDSKAEEREPPRYLEV